MKPFTKDDVMRNITWRCKKVVQKADPIDMELSFEPTGDLTLSYEDCGMVPFYRFQFVMGYEARLPANQPESIELAKKRAAQHFIAAMYMDVIRRLYMMRHEAEFKGTQWLLEQIDKLIKDLEE